MRRLKEIRGRLIKSSLWIAGGRVLSNGLNALNTVILARLLLPTDFGLVALATSLFAFLAAITELSLVQALVRTSEPTDDHYHTAWTLGVVRALLLGGGFAVSAPFIAEAYHEPRLQAVIYVLALSAVVSSLQNPKLVALQKDLRFEQTFILTTVCSLLNVACAIGVAVATRSYWALVVGAIVSQAAYAVLSYLFVPYRPQPRINRLGELWRFSLWVSLGQIVHTVNYRADQFLVGTFVGQRQLGLYTVGSRLAVMPGQEIVRPLTATLFPAFSLVKDDPVRLARAYARTQGMVTAIALPASLGFALLADPAVRLLLGEKWIAAIPVVQMIGVLYSLDTLGSLVNPLAMSRGETRVLFIRSCQKLALRLPLLIVGLYFGGLMGLLYGRMLAGALGNLIDMAMINRLIGLSIVDQLKANLRVFLAAGAMSVAALGLSALIGHPQGQLALGATLVGVASAGAATYVLATLALWVAAGRPDGPETEIIHSLSRLTRRLAGVRARTGKPTGQA